ncbi:MAG: aspartate carbamoyltransferase [Candidatus Micrarchaeales archaeon]
MAITRLKHFTSAKQVDRALADDLFERTDQMRQKPLLYSEALHGKTLVLEFYEPSTRTRHSFEAAITRLGGHYTSTENATAFSSSAKGESVEDTARVVSAYGDAIVVRSKEIGVADRMAAVSRVPVINAGDGTGQHPTQALLDLYTIKKEVGRLENLTIAIVGDLAHGRTARSLTYLLAKCGDVRTIFVSPPGFGIDEDLREWLKRHGKEFSEETDLNSILGIVDVVYITRVQKERMPPEEYEKARGKLIFTEESLALMQKHARVMHPLPKVDEIDIPIRVEQEDQRIAYFRQSENGVWVRMALLENMLRD